MNDGYVDYHVRRPLERALEKHQVGINIIPVRLEECQVPSRIGQLQWVDIYKSQGYERILSSLIQAAEALGINKKDDLSLKSVTSGNKRPLRVFLGHTSEDKSIVRKLYNQLKKINWIDPWLDEANLLPGQEWETEIVNAVRTADAVIVCLSQRTVSKEGYIQKELHLVLDSALEKPLHATYVIPIRLDDCHIPRSFREWQTADYFPKEPQKQTYERLLMALAERSKDLGLDVEKLDLPLESDLQFRVVQKVEKQETVRAFISYSRKDVGFIKKLAVDLQTVGLDVWWDISGLEGGDNWIKSIQDALDKSQYCIVVLTPDSIRSPWVEREYTYAMNNRIVVIPILLRDCKLPFSFSTIQYIDFRDKRYRSALRELYSSINLKVVMKK